MLVCFLHCKHFFSVASLGEIKTMCRKIFFDIDIGIDGNKIHKELLHNSAC